jgi:hypothetical protein
MVDLLGSLEGLDVGANVGGNVCPLFAFRWGLSVLMNVGSWVGMYVGAECRSVVGLCMSADIRGRLLA